MPQTTIPYKGQQFLVDYQITAEGDLGDVTFSNFDGSDIGLDAESTNELYHTALPMLFADPRVADKKWDRKDYPRIAQGQDQQQNN